MAINISSFFLFPQNYPIFVILPKILNFGPSNQTIQLQLQQNSNKVYNIFIFSISFKCEELIVFKHQQSMISVMNNLNSRGNPFSMSTRNPKSNVNHTKNIVMNKSAVLMDKFPTQSAQELPRYVVANRKQVSHKSFKLTRGLRNGENKNKTINKIMQASIKQVMKQQNSNKRFSGSEKQLRTKPIKKQKLRGKNYPREIINLLYRQRIKNYNPFIQALSKLEDMKMDANEKEKIKRLCYIGIARDYFQKKKYFMLPNYSRVGILIRAYMIKVMRGNMEQKKETQPHSIYIPINETALSFNPYERPKQLQDLMTKKRFADIINKGNKIIQNEYQQYKRGNFQNIKNKLTYSQIFMYVCLTIIVICLLSWDVQFGSDIGYLLFALIFVVVFGSMALAWVECKKTIGKVCPPSNIIKRIVEKLRNYFKSVSDQTLSWRIGPDFYWLEIENMNIQKRKMQANNDNF